MTIVGKKEIFAIEWYINGHCENWIDANLRFWGNCQEIGIWNHDEPLHANINWAKEHLQSKKYSRQLPIEFSHVSKEDIFESIYNADYTAEFPEKYRDFYRQCKAVFIDEYRSGRWQHTPKEKMDECIARGDSFVDDFTLGNWIGANFNITDDAADNFSHYLYLIRVHDIIKKRERLVWKYFDLKDINGNVLQVFPVQEALLPLSYFSNTLSEFVNLASEEIAQVHDSERKQ